MSSSCDQDARDQRYAGGYELTPDAVQEFRVSTTTGAPVEYAIVIEGDLDVVETIIADTPPSPPQQQPPSPPPQPPPENFLLNGNTGLFVGVTLGAVAVMTGVVFAARAAGWYFAKSIVKDAASVVRGDTVVRVNPPGQPLLGQGPSVSSGV